MSRTLRIGIDAHAVGERKTGNERFIANVARELRGICDHELILYFTDEAAAGAWQTGAWHTGERHTDGRTEVRVLRPSSPFLRIPFSMPAAARRDRLDVLLVQYSASARIRCPVVTVVHDVSFAVHPESFTALERLWMPRTIPATMRRAAAVVTVSSFSRDEIRRVYGIPEARIVVAPNGVDPVFERPAPASGQWEPPYLLWVGNIEPRKNLGTVVRAFEILMRRHPETADRLLVVGTELRGGGDSVRREAAELERSGRIAFLGRIDDVELAGLLQRAIALVYPSVYEGFGLPVVEAMACGIPVLASDIPVMREVAGEAAALLPARDAEAWAEAMLEISTDGARRAHMSALGRERAASFTWRRTAEAVLGALEGAVAGG